MRRRFIVFFFALGLFTLYMGLHAQRLWPAHPGAGWGAVFSFFALMLTWQTVHRADQSDPQSFRYRALAWTGTVAMGVWATFLFFCLAIDILSLLLLPLGLLRPGALTLDAQMLRQGPIILAALSAIFAVAGLIQAVHGPVIARVQVPIKGLPEALRGLKIALISDLHIGPTIRERYVADVVRRTEELKPDLIAVTGDLADESADRLNGQIAPLKELNAPLGTFYVTGNHEYYWGAEEWLAKARSWGWVPLINENKVLSVKGSKVLVAGITDAQGALLPGHAPDLEAAAEGGKEAGVHLLLSHRPGVYAEAEKAGFDLQLSGHTHGGQFFPWSLVIPFVHRFYKDLNRFRNLWIYVNPGTGYWGPPHRFLVPSEITLLELVPASR